MSGDQPSASAVAEGMTEFMEALAPVREAAIGFHNQLIAGGFPPGAAEEASKAFLILALNKVLQ